MREILFRGKLKSNDEWSFGNLNVSLRAIVIITPDETPIGKYGQVIPETVGQYTGLTDKNGKKIFEGDILKNIESGRIVAICYSGCSFCYSYNGTIYGIDDSETGLETNEWEIIGNIHDNPELLEV